MNCKKMKITTYFISARLTILARPFANGRYVRLSLCPSVRHTLEPRLNGSKYRNIFHTV